MVKASDKATIPSQKNLNEVITAYIENTDTIIKKLIKNASTYDNYKNVVKNIDNYHKIIDHIFSSKGILMSIIQLTSNIDAKQSIGTLNAIKTFIKNLSSLIDYISTRLAAIADVGSALNFSIMENTYVKVVESINKVIEIISKLKIKVKLHFKLLLIRWQFNSVKNFIDKIGEIGTDMMAGIKKAVSAFSKFKMIDLIVQSLDNLFSAIYSIPINIVKLKYKLWRIKLALKQVFKIFEIINNNDIVKNNSHKKIILATMSIMSMTIIIISINYLINLVRGVKIGIKFLWKLSIFKFALTKIIDVANELKQLDKKSINIKTLKSFLSFALIINLIVYITKIIRGSTAGPILWIKMLMFKFSLTLLSDIITEFKNIKYDKRYIVKALNIKKFLKSVISIFTLINVNIPNVLLSIVGFVAVNIAVFALSFTLGAVIGIINALKKPIVTGFISLLLIKSFVNKLIVTMILLALVSIPMLVFTIPILLFLGASALILGAVMLVGTLIVSTSPIMIPAISGFTLLSLMIGALIITALLLSAFALIKLDVKKIKENIKAVLDCTSMIINEIFNKDTNENTSDSKNSIFGSIISFVGSTLAPIIKAIVAIPYLLLMITSICIITIIAGQLKLIQNIELNDKKIKENVNSILSTVTVIGDYLMNLFPEKKDKKQVKQMKKIMRKVSRIVTHIKNIGEKVNYIATIEIDEAAVNANVNKIFNIIKNLETQMISFNTESNTKDAETDKKENIIDAIKNARKQKKLFKQNKKIVKRTDKILVEVNDIAEKLEYLSKFTITDTMKTDIINNVSAIFSVIDEINDQLNNRNNKDQIEETSIKDNIIKARKEKKLLKVTNKKINKTDKILLNIVDLIDSLESLCSKDFDISSNKKIILSNISNITEIMDNVSNKLFNIKNKNKDEKLLDDEKLFFKIKNFFKNTNSLLEVIHEVKSDNLKEDTEVVGSVITFINALSKKLRTVKIRSFSDKKLDNIKNVKKIILEVNSILLALKTLEKFNINISEQTMEKLKFGSVIMILVNEIDNTFNRNIVNLIKKNINVDINSAVKIITNYVTSLKLIEKALNSLNEITISEEASNKLLNKTHILFETLKSFKTQIRNYSKHLTLSKKDKDNINGSDVFSLIKYIKGLNTEISALSNVNYEGLERNTNTYIKFIDKVNTMDVKKLETSTKMFEQMSKFSTSIRGDFDRLAEALNENLMPVLEELKEIMEKIPEKLDTGFQNTSASIAATSAPATRENVEAQARRENPNITPEEVTKVVDTRMAEKAKQDATGMISKLDELISLLKGYGGENVVVQTV